VQLQWASPIPQKKNAEQHGVSIGQIAGNPFGALYSQLPHLKSSLY